jgi:hypothetical protein
MTYSKPSLLSATTDTLDVAVRASSTTFVMLNALRETRAAKAAITQAVGFLRTALSAGNA